MSLQTVVDSDWSEIYPRGDKSQWTADAEPPGCKYSYPAAPPLLTTPSVLLFILSRKKLNWCVPTCTTHPRRNSSRTSVNLEIHPCLKITDSSVSSHRRCDCSLVLRQALTFFSLFGWVVDFTPKPRETNQPAPGSDAGTDLDYDTANPPPLTETVRSP
ncbi:unnamed protein product, partial [Ectocarpus sp. 4 AP-2014]